MATIQQTTAGIMLKNKIDISDYTIVLGWVCDAINTYRTSYVQYTEKVKLIPDDENRVRVPAMSDKIINVFIPLRGRWMPLTELDDMVDTQTLNNGILTRNLDYGENETPSFRRDDPVNMLGYYKVDDDYILLVTESKYDNVVVEYRTNGILNDSSIVPNNYEPMLNKYVKWQKEMNFGSNRSYSPMYQKIYEDACLLLRNSEEQYTMDDIVDSMTASGVFDRHR